jgi:hypothetical protein
MSGAHTGTARGAVILRGTDVEQHAYAVDVVRDGEVVLAVAVQVRRRDGEGPIAREVTGRGSERAVALVAKLANLQESARPLIRLPISSRAKEC